MKITKVNVLEPRGDSKLRITFTLEDKKHEKIFNKNWRKMQKFTNDFMKNVEFEASSSKHRLLTIEHYMHILAFLIYNQMQHAEKDALIEILAGKRGTRIDTFSSWIFFIAGFLGIELGIAFLNTYVNHLLVHYEIGVFFAGTILQGLATIVFVKIIWKVKSELNSTQN